MNELYLAHHGILGQKWGIRRYQPYSAGYQGEHSGRYIGKQRKEARLLKKAARGRGWYRSVYDRATNYYNKSKEVQERAKELKPLADKINSIGTELELFSYDSDKVMKLATKNATESSRKMYPDFDQKSEKEQERILDSFLYDGNYIEKAAKQINKSDPKFRQLQKERREAVKEYKKQASEIADQIIGKYGTRKVRGLSDSKVTYKEMVNYALTKGGAPWSFTQEDKLGRR